MNALDRHMLAIECNLTQEEASMVARVINGKQKRTDYVYSDSITAIQRVIRSDEKLFISNLGNLIRSGKYARRVVNGRIMICDQSVLCTVCQVHRGYVLSVYSMFRRFKKRLCLSCNEIQDHEIE